MSLRHKLKEFGLQEHSYDLSGDEFDQITRKMESLLVRHRDINSGGFATKDEFDKDRQFLIHDIKKPFTFISIYLVLLPTNLTI